MRTELEFIPRYSQRCAAIAGFATLIGLLGHSPGFWMSKAMTPPGRDPLHGGFQFILELKGRFGGMRARPARWRR